MSLMIIAPLPSDTVASPVTVTTAYNFGASSFTITTKLTGAIDSTSGSLTGSGLSSVPMTTASTGAGTADANSNPAGGGSNSVSGFTIGSAPPIIIDTVTPLPPPPPVPPPSPTGVQGAAALANKKYDADGSIKGTTITSVKYRVKEANPANGQITVVVQDTAATITGNKWKAKNIPITPVAGRFYVLQATGYDQAGNPVGQFSKAIPT